MMSGKRDSNSRPQPWQGCALPTELFPHIHNNIDVLTTRIELARLSTLAPETSASTIPPREHQFTVLSGKRDSNSRPQPWQGCALPTELFPHIHNNIDVLTTRIELARLSTLAPETSASTIPPREHQFTVLSGKRDSNSRPQPWQGCALPTELFPHLSILRKSKFNLLFQVIQQPSPRP